MAAMDGESRTIKWSELVVRAGLTSRWAGDCDPAIGRVVEHSREAGRETCFVAVRGTKSDGHDFIDAAVRIGAAAVIAEKAVALPPNIPLLIVKDTHGAACRMAMSLHGLDEAQRAGRLKLIGITGTNGKSTFCYMTRSILRAAGRRPAMFGTIEYDVLTRRIEAGMTTPPAVTLVGYLAEAVRAGATHAVMEVSSHALDQGRADGLDFSVGVFSNLTGDHLDYHQTMEAYLRAKKRLFDGLSPDSVAVINQDDAAADQMVADCRARIVRYSLTPGAGEVSAHIRRIDATGTHFELLLKDEVLDARIESLERVDIQLPLIGRHNVQNALAAIGAARAVGIRLGDIVDGLSSLRCVPGRLQRVTLEGSVRQPEFAVLVDYAHTDDALQNVLSSLRALTDRRLIVLFGCGGDRDRSKRPRMAEVASRFADHVVVTSDNPRTECPERILDDIMAGFPRDRLSRVHMEPDRRAAIAAALSMAEPGDIVLLAGKGHENYQLIGNERLAFDDAAVAAEILAGELMNAG